MIITSRHNGFYGLYVSWIQDRWNRRGSVPTVTTSVMAGPSAAGHLRRSGPNSAAIACVWDGRPGGRGAAYESGFPSQRLWLLSHSMGSVPTLFSVPWNCGRWVFPSGAWSCQPPVSRLDFWPEELLGRWAESGTITMCSIAGRARTCPMVREFLAEIPASVHQMEHGPSLGVPAGHPWQEDEAVSRTTAESLVSLGPRPGRRPGTCRSFETGHTFGTRHPFEGPAGGHRETIDTCLFRRSGPECPGPAHVRPGCRNWR